MRPFDYVFTAANPLAFADPLGLALIERGSLTPNIGQVAARLGQTLGRKVSPEEVNRVIHILKKAARASGSKTKMGNPDVMIDMKTWNVYYRVVMNLEDDIGNLLWYIF